MSATALDRLPPGSHLCRFYRDDSDLAVGAASFVATGLAAGARVVYVASDRDPGRVASSLERRAVGAARALSAGQLVIRTSDEVYGQEELDFSELEAGFTALHQRALADGLVGLRVAAEMGNAVERFGSVESLVRWEATATRLQQTTGISTVCQYDRRRFSPTDRELLTAEHTGIAPASAAVPMAGFYVERDAIRIVGEVDLSNSHRFLEVIEARAAVHPHLVLDVAGLTFIDVGAMSMLRRLVHRGPGVRLTLRHASPALRRHLSLLGPSHPRLVVS